MRKPVTIIVNADDLGMSRCVNDAIFTMMGRGKVTSATILANAPEVREACGKLSLFPQCSFGVHLNVTEYEPLSRSGAQLLDNGRFSRKIAAAKPSERVVRAVYEEFCAQVDRLISFGVPISHIDSHHHIHTTPAGFLALKALQRRYGIRRVRLSKNLYAPADRPGMARLWGKHAYNAALRNVYRTTTTAGFTELRTYARLLSEQGIPAMPSVELMTHPGADRYSDETNLLENGWTGDWSAFRLISYAALEAGSS